MPTEVSVTVVTNGFGFDLPQSVWCESRQVSPQTQDNARINGFGSCIKCGHSGTVIKTGVLRRHKR